MFMLIYLVLLSVITTHAADHSASWTQPRYGSLEEHTVLEKLHDIAIEQAFSAQVLCSIRPWMPKIQELIVEKIDIYTQVVRKENATASHLVPRKIDCAPETSKSLFSWPWTKPSKKAPEYFLYDYDEASLAHVVEPNENIEPGPGFSKDLTHKRIFMQGMLHRLYAHARLYNTLSWAVRNEPYTLSAFDMEFLLDICAQVETDNVNLKDDSEDAFPKKGFEILHKYASYKACIGATSQRMLVPTQDKFFVSSGPLENNSMLYSGPNKHIKREVVSICKPLGVNAVLFAHSYNNLIRPEYITLSGSDKDVTAAAYDVELGNVIFASKNELLRLDVSAPRRLHLFEGSEGYVQSIKALGLCNYLVETENGKQWQCFFEDNGGSFICEPYTGVRLVDAKSKAVWTACGKELYVQCNEVKEKVYDFSSDITKLVPVEQNAYLIRTNDGKIWRYLWQSIWQTGAIKQTEKPRCIEVSEQIEICLGGHQCTNVTDITYNEPTKTLTCILSDGKKVDLGAFISRGSLTIGPDPNSNETCVVNSKIIAPPYFHANREFCFTDKVSRNNEDTNLSADSSSSSSMDTTTCNTNSAAFSGSCTAQSQQSVVQATKSRRAVKEMKDLQTYLDEGWQFDEDSED